jgi:hypothetical protein
MCREGLWVACPARLAGARQDGCAGPAAGQAQDVTGLQ